MTAPTVGLALIVKNEAENLPRLFKSIEGAFDQVVLVDTGSTDATKDIFAAWASAQGGLPYRIADFEWIHDFAAVRNYADSLLTTDFTAWADADDTIEGAQHLRQLAAKLAPDAAAAIADYLYAFDPWGNCVCTLRRERLVRRGAGQWIGRVHEAQVIRGNSTLVDPQIVHWRHHKIVGNESNARNLEILRAWVIDEPENPRVLGYLGTEEAAHGDHETAVGFYQRYIEAAGDPAGWPQECSQIHRKLALSMLALGRPQEALTWAWKGFHHDPAWADTRLSLAQAYYHLERYERAEYWANDLLRLGPPDTLLIVNPRDYDREAYRVLAAATGATGRVDEAIEWADKALAIVPEDPELQGHRARWMDASKREATARTVCAFAQSLIAHDEQDKALGFLETCVPYYCVDHPAVVQLRSFTRERVRPLLLPAGVASHYEAGTEDGMTVEFAAQLPRAHFLARGVKEQLTEGD